LRLVSGSGLKGLRVQSKAIVSDVATGALVDEQSELVFFKNVGNHLDANMAIMGFNKAFNGNGDLLQVRSEHAIDIASLKITARGTDNSDLEVRLDKVFDSPLPQVFSLNANYPNPFNPSTTIPVYVPSAMDPSVPVCVDILDILGQRISTLWAGTLRPGRHVLRWDGRDGRRRAVASGIYFYRLRAGSIREVRPMTLLR